MTKYYKWCDAVIGNLRIGSFEFVELEAVMCKKPVINFTDKKIKIIFGKNYIESPFIPENNDPEIIAHLIDKIVLSEQFREEVFRKEFEFVKNISNPDKAGEWWDLFFTKLKEDNISINRNSSRIQIKLRMLNFLIANRLYFKKIKKIFIK